MTWREHFAMGAIFAAILVVAILAAVFSGCAEFQSAAAGAGIGALETVEAAAGAGAGMAEQAAESAETPIGMVGNWIAWIGLTGLAAGCAWLRKRLQSARAGSTLMTSKIEKRSAEGATAQAVKNSIAKAAATAPTGIKSEIFRAAAG